MVVNRNESMNTPLSQEWNAFRYSYILNVSTNVKKPYIKQYFVNNNNGEKYFNK